MAYQLQHLFCVQRCGSVDHREFLLNLAGNVRHHQPVAVTFHERLLRAEVVALCDLPHASARLRVHPRPVA